MSTICGIDKLIGEKDGAIGWITFNNPARHNAVSMSMWQALFDVVSDFAADDAIRVVVVKGAGDRAFVSGADISEFEEKRSSPETTQAYNATAHRASQALKDVNKPTIAMIRGYCIGGGTAAAVCCDLRICTENAKFGVPAAKLGLGYGLNRAQPLVDLVGPAFAKEMFFTGRQFDAREAEKMGLVNRVVADDALEATIDEMTRTIAANAPLTVRCAKLVVGEALKDVAERDVAAADRAVAACFASADYKEGQAAFMEKRKPRFIGA
jgi:enoyl-CoA hydratase